MLNIQRLARGLGLLIGLMTLAACTPSETKTSRMMISIPQMTKANSGQSLQLGHLVINISGPGIPSTILQVWETCKNCANQSPIPSQVFVDVPTGKDRLVQVLAAYENSTNYSMNLYYGDKVAEFSKSEERIVIPVTDLTGGLPLVSGALSGRYLDTANAGPTGEVEIRYQPPNGRPSLIFDRSRIANGWFNFFALRGVGFRYVIPATNRDIFGQAIDLADRTILQPSDRVAKLFVPYSSYRDSNNVMQNNEDVEVHAIGYFGPGAGANRKICATVSGSDQMDYKYVYGSAAVPLGFSILANNAAEPTTASLRTALPSIQIQGGVIAGDPVCNSMIATAASDAYQNFLPLGKASFNNGRDEIAGFRYPFGMVNYPSPSPTGLTGNSFNYTINSGYPLYISSSPYHIGGKLLPGLASLVTKVRAYKVPAAGSNQMRDMEFAPCDRIGNGDSFGSVYVAETPFTSNGGFIFNSTLTAAERSSGTGLAMCFEGINGPLKAGLFLRPDMFPGGGGGGGGGSSPYLRIENLFEYRNNNMTIKPLTNNRCVQVQLRTFAPGGGMGPAPTYNLVNALQVTFENTKFAFYDTSTDCESNTNLRTSVNMSAGSNTLGLYMKTTATGADSGEITLGLSTSEVIYSSDGMFTMGNPRLRAMLSSNLASGACVASYFQAFEADGMTPYPLNDSFLITPDSPRGATSFRTGNCGGSNFASSTLSGGRTTTMYYIAPSTGGESVTATSIAGWTIDPVTVSIGAGSLSAVKVQVVTPGSVTFGACTQGKIQVVNESGTSVPAPVDMNFELKLDGQASLHDDSQCMASFTGTQIAAGQSEILFYYRGITNAADFSIGINVPGMPTQASSLINQSPPAGAAPYVVVQNSFPYRHKRVLGSHEFDASGFMWVNFAISGAVQSCQKSPANTNCLADWDAANSRLKVHKSDLSSNQTFFISVQATGGWTFRAFSVADLFGNPVNVQECAIVHSANITHSDLVTGVNCLADGFEYAQTPGVSADLNDKSLIGSAITMSPAYASDVDLFTLTTPASPALKLANVRMHLAMNANGVNYTGNGIPVSFEGIEIELPNAGSSTGLRLVNFANTIVNGLEVITAAGANGYGILAENNLSTVDLKNVKITATNALSTFVGVKLYASGTDMNVTRIRDYKFTGEGHGLQLNAAPSRSITMNDSQDWDITTAAGVPLAIEGSINLNLDGLRIEQYSAGGSPIELSSNSGASSVNLKNARVASNNGDPMIWLILGGAGASYSFDFQNTHFVSRQSKTSFFVNQPGAPSVLSLQASVAATTNRVCAETPFTTTTIENPNTSNAVGNFSLANLTTVPVGAKSCY